MLQAPGFHELRAEDEDRARVVDPDEQQHHCPGRAVRVADAAMREIQVDQRFADDEQDGGDARNRMKTKTANALWLTRRFLR